MSLLVVGSVAFDSVKTPFGEAEEVLGGSATYFSVSASFFTEVRLVAVVGEDFPKAHLDFLRSREIDLKGLEVVPGSTFRWRGEYGWDLNEARTLDTRLNVFESFRPRLPEDYLDSEHLFLANIDPELQMSVLEQLNGPELVALDTMNFWIEGKPEALRETLSRAHILLINDSETRELAREPNIVKAARRILSWGPRAVIVKRGEYGALMFSEDGVFSAPAYPLEDIFDPTGAGDSFAGGFMGYLASTRNLSPPAIRQAIILGSVMASFNVEAFSLERFKSLTHTEVEERFREFKRLAHFEEL